MFSFLNINILAIALASLALLVLFLLIITIITIKKLNKINHHTTNGNLAETITTYYNRIDMAESNIKSQLEHISLIEKRFQSSIQKVGAIRYNALEGVGSDQSFSLAMLDEHDDGFVLTGIYTRDAASVSYLKPIQQLASAIPLSKEEEQAIIIAQKKYTEHIK
jgi:hypothetical protein